MEVPLARAVTSPDRSFRFVRAEVSSALLNSAPEHRNGIASVSEGRSAIERSSKTHPRALSCPYADWARAAERRSESLTMAFRAFASLLLASFKESRTRLADQRRIS